MTITITMAIAVLLLLYNYYYDNVYTKSISHYPVTTPISSLLNPLFLFLFPIPIFPIPLLPIALLSITITYVLCSVR